MATDDMDAFAEQIREAVFDCLLVEILRERQREEADELSGGASFAAARADLASVRRILSVGRRS